MTILKKLNSSKYRKFYISENVETDDLCIIQVDYSSIVDPEVDADVVIDINDTIISMKDNVDLVELTYYTDYLKKKDYYVD